MKIVLHASAVEDLEAISAWISKDNPDAAAVMVDRILSAVQRLDDFPEMGRSGRDEGTRELIVPRLPFIIVYETDFERDTVTVIAIFHGARERN